MSVFIMSDDEFSPIKAVNLECIKYLKIESCPPVNDDGDDEYFIVAELFDGNNLSLNRKGFKDEYDARIALRNLFNDDNLKEATE